MTSHLTIHVTVHVTSLHYHTDDDDPFIVLTETKFRSHWPVHKYSTTPVNPQNTPKKTANLRAEDPPYAPNASAYTITNPIQMQTHNHTKQKSTHYGEPVLPQPPKVATAPARGYTPGGPCAPAS